MGDRVVQGDFIQHLFTGHHTHEDYLMFSPSRVGPTKRRFTVPRWAGRTKGRSIANLLELRPDEQIAATIRVQSKKSGNRVQHRR